MAYVLGVDLGTTYSAAAVDDGARTEIVTLGVRAATIPSIVLARADGTLLVGEAAERRAAEEPSRVAREFKRRVGDPAPAMLGGAAFATETLTARLLREVMTEVARQRGVPPRVTVLCHPAAWGPYKLDLLRQAARQADSGPLRLISEPEAAALHYAERERIGPGEVVAVYDFGGGTLDVAILRRMADGFALLGEPEGLERLGGIDFDEAIFGHVVTALGEAWHALDRMNPAVSPAAQRLRAECRQAKETLSVDSDVTIPVLLPGINTTVRLTRGEFEELIRPSVGETVAALRRAARSAGLRMHEVARILLVGGSSRIPLVAELLRAETGRPVALDAHPKHAIALGAARSARDALSAGVGPAARRPPERTAPVVTTAATTSAPAPSVALPSSYDVVDPTLVIRAPAPAPTPAPQSLSTRVATPAAAILLVSLFVVAVIVILR